MWARPDVLGLFSGSVGPFLDGECFAMPAPIPFETPVTMATFPVNACIAALISGASSAFPRPDAAHHARPGPG